MRLFFQDNIGDIIHADSAVLRNSAAEPKYKSADLVKCAEWAKQLVDKARASVAN